MARFRQGGRGSELFLGGASPRAGYGPDTHWDAVFKDGASLASSVAFHPPLKKTFNLIKFSLHSAYITLLCNKLTHNNHRHHQSIY